MIFNRDNAGIFGDVDYDMIETVHRRGLTTSARRRAVDGKYIATPTTVGPWTDDDDYDDKTNDACGYVDELYDDGHREELVYEDAAGEYSYAFSGGKIFFGSSKYSGNTNYYFYVYDIFLKTLSRFCNLDYFYGGQDIVTAWPAICIYDSVSYQYVHNAITCAKMDDFVTMGQYEQIDQAREYGGKAYVMSGSNLYVQNGDNTRTNLVSGIASGTGFVIHRMEIYTIKNKSDGPYLLETDTLGSRTNEYKLPDGVTLVTNSRITGMLGDYLYYTTTNSAGSVETHAFDMRTKSWEKGPCKNTLSKHLHVFDCDAVTTKAMYYITPEGDVRRVTWK